MNKSMLPLIVGAGAYIWLLYGRKGTGPWNKRRTEAFGRVDLKTSTPRDVFGAGWDAVAKGPYTSRMRRLELQAEVRAVRPLLDLIDETPHTISLMHTDIARSVKRDIAKGWYDRLAKIDEVFSYEGLNLEAELDMTRSDQAPREVKPEPTITEIGVILARGAAAPSVTAAGWSQMRCAAAFADLELADMLPRELFDMGWAKASAAAADDRWAIRMLEYSLGRARRLEDAIVGMKKMHAMAQEAGVPLVVKRSIATHWFERMCVDLGLPVFGKSEQFGVVVDRYLAAVSPA